MVNSISSSGSAMSMMRNNAMQRQPPSQGKDAFQASDVDDNGLVSKTELSTLATGIEKITGQTVNVDESISTYDANQDGGLSGEELLSMLDALGFSPPEMTSSDSDDASANRPPPPPPPSSEQAISAYSQNSGDDLMAKLLEFLQQQGDTVSQSYTQVDVVS